jgi:hypothetical protein
LRRGRSFRDSNNSIFSIQATRWSLNDIGEEQDQPENQEHVEDDPNVKKYIEKLAVGEFVFHLFVSS